MEREATAKERKKKEKIKPRKHTAESKREREKGVWKQSRKDNLGHLHRVRAVLAVVFTNDDAILDISNLVVVVIVFLLDARARPPTLADITL